LLYDEDGLHWVRQASGGEVVVGITSIHAAIAGRPSKIVARPLGAAYARGKTIGTVESPKFYGPIRAPVTGTLREVNPSVLSRPRLIVDATYGEGWFARIAPTKFDEDRKSLLRGEAARNRLADQIRALRVHCFAAFPDYDMIEIGTECAAVLTKLNDLLVRIEPGEVVHIVSDDPTAPIEMVRWSDQTGQPVIETRREGNLYHFLVRKAN